MIMPIRARIVLAILLAAILGGGTWFYLLRTEPQPTITLTLFGNVDIREVQPIFNASGHITTMLVQEGTTVKKGQLPRRWTIPATPQRWHKPRPPLRA